MAGYSVTIGSARIDENGHAKGGKAGDQTGKEVSTQKYYIHSKGWRVFRAKDPAKAEQIAYDMKAACANQHIGYDQSQRLTLYNIAKAVNFDCAKVDKNCETDCSALVRVCCAYAGIMLPNFRTTDEASILLKSGYFTEMTGDKYTKSQLYLKRGDILVTRTQGHTVIVLTNGKRADETPTPVEYKHILVTGKTVHVRRDHDMHSPSVTIVKKGTRFPYDGECVDGWYRIKHETPLWISSRYSILTV